MTEAAFNAARALTSANVKEIAEVIDDMTGLPGLLEEVELLRRENRRLKGLAEPKPTPEIKNPLTRLVFEYIKKQLDETGFSPSYREIMEACQLSSTSQAHLHVERLEGMGLISRLVGKARSFRVNL